MRTRYNPKTIKTSIALPLPAQLSLPTNQWDKWCLHRYKKITIISITNNRCKPMDLNKWCHRCLWMEFPFKAIQWTNNSLFCREQEALYHLISNSLGVNLVNLLKVELLKWLPMATEDPSPLDILQASSLLQERFLPRCKVCPLKDPCRCKVSLTPCSIPSNHQTTDRCLVLSRMCSIKTSKPTTWTCSSIILSSLESSLRCLRTVSSLYRDVTNTISQSRHPRRNWTFWKIQSLKERVSSLCRVWTRKDNKKLLWRGSRNLRRGTKVVPTPSVPFTSASKSARMKKVCWDITTRRIRSCSHSVWNYSNPSKGLALIREAGVMSATLEERFRILCWLKLWWWASFTRLRWRTSWNSWMKSNHWLNEVAMCFKLNIT